MPLTIGARLGPYEILAPFGTGAMGEVWTARDTRLDRPGEVMAADIAMRNGSLDIRPAHALFGGIITTRGFAYYVSADGQKVLVVQDNAGSVTAPLMLVQNWTAALARK